MHFCKSKSFVCAPELCFKRGRIVQHHGSVVNTVVSQALNLLGLPIDSSYLCMWLMMAHWTYPQMCTDILGALWVVYFSFFALVLKRRAYEQDLWHDSQFGIQPWSNILHTHTHVYCQGTNTEKGFQSEGGDIL